MNAEAAKTSAELILSVISHAWGLLERLAKGAPDPVAIARLGIDVARRGEAQLLRLQKEHEEQRAALGGGS